jgi:hypothetical protein
MSSTGMSNRGSPEGHMGHICVVMRATHDMPDKQYGFFVQNVFYTWKYDRLFPSVKNILHKENILYVRHVVCGPHDNTNVTHMALGGPSV